MSKFDLLIRNGTIIDGTGKDKYVGDLGIVDEKIVEIGDLKNAEANKIIEAQGKYIAPGFIDAHSHGDMTILAWPKSDNYIMQGVTTIIAGNCGYMPAPIKDIYQFTIWESKAIHEFAPSYFVPTQLLDLEKVKKAMKKVYDIDMDWTTVDGYLSKLENKKISVNFCPVVGHNQIRAAAMGADCARPANPEEIEEMKKLLIEAINDGVIGMTVGLDYHPGMFASKEELIELAKVLKEHDLLYTTHWRSLPDPQGGYNMLTGFKEALSIAEETGVKMQISHLLPLYSIRPERTPELTKAAAEATIKLIVDSIKKGARIAYDVIPNHLTGGVLNYENLILLLKPYVLMAGSVEQFVKNLGVPDYRTYLEEDIEKVGKKYLTMSKPNWENMFTISQSKIKSYEDKTIKEISLEQDKTPLNVVLDILKEDPYTKMIMTLEQLPIEGVEIFTSHPLGMIGADVFACDKDASFDYDEPLNSTPNPNTFSYAIKYITKFRRPRIEDTIRSMTGYPAEWFGLKDRGTIEKNKFADIVIFDLENLKCYDEEVDYKQYPDGINQVIVNGKLTAENKNHLGVKEGKVLRKQI